ncbi:DUF58 domain-containing protein [Pinibacter soli]|uniref:DUF58 domain-containing protein n=1 Tax=Pinibacter soli TaxID=3044211 RepID=A0ABT6RGK9_9BACT|nr:DUF58 domain-containing protein [Pinibacter soli]MDI3321561.1 DUF58 domain-containing protein [Pinibacter soli]
MKKKHSGSPFYFSRLFYIIMGCIIAAFALAFFFPELMLIAKMATLFLCIAALFDLLLVFGKKMPVTAERLCSDRFSNGDDNPVTIKVRNQLGYAINVQLLDEVPVQFQLSNVGTHLKVPANGTSPYTYILKPTERGVYNFGIINILFTGPLNMIVRHIRSGEEKDVATYPSYMQMRRFQLMAATNQLMEAGSRQLRKIGNSLEFEQIKEYVSGDDYRTVNWKASARRNTLMINNYMDERSQQVICIIDKGRTMKMPFEGMTLLDYAINASLVLSNMVLMKQDKAGLITFGKKMGQTVMPDKKGSQLGLILESLYRQQTDFQDSDFESLYSDIRYKVKQRSLLILFTNFENMYSLERQLPYLKKLANHHPLLVIFFENSELSSFLNEKAHTIEDIYTHTIASKFAFEKKQIVRELQKHGIMSLLTEPNKLTVNALNKYLELKARQIV